MKRILVLIIVLLTAIVTMAYLYFTGLSTAKKNGDHALYAATFNTAVVFAFQNDKSVLDILSGQSLLREVIGEEKSKQLSRLNQYLFSKPSVNHLAEAQNIYISLFPGKSRNIDFLYTTQLNGEATIAQLVKVLKSVSSLDSINQDMVKLTLPDSSIFYLGYKDNLVLLSSAQKPVEHNLSGKMEKTSQFTEFILSTSRLNKNSLAELYINYNALPELLKAVLPGNLSGELAILKHQDAFASLVYNYSAKKILFSGNTQINDPNSYYQLFSGFPAQKTTINNLLPKNTANYTLYTIPDYSRWRTLLNGWFTKRNESDKVNATLNKITNKYHLDTEQGFPKYFKHQVITFQLSTTEKLGAIELSNGDKLRQLLIDLSNVYDEDIKSLKEPDLLYCYFGEPLRKFKRPYYTIIDNYMVFANHASTVKSFLNSYKNNELMISNTDYINSINQLPNTSGITFFVNLRNSSNIFLKNIYLPYYRHINGEKGLKNSSSFIYQLSGEHGKFQTNVLLNKKEEAFSVDSAGTAIDSLAAIPQQ